MARLVLAVPGAMTWRARTGRRLTTLVVRTRQTGAQPIGEGRSMRMAKIIAAITVSVDGYITGPDDGPDKGLGEGGERLHYWVFGGPWSYESEPRGEPEGVDADYLNRRVRQSRWATFIEFAVKR